MSKKSVLLLLRFVIISVLYALWCIFCGFCSTLMYYPVFIPMLVLYLILMIISIRVSGIKAAKIRITADLMFIILFSLDALYLLCVMMSTSDVGETFFGVLAILMYSPMLILFIIWLRTDVKTYKMMRNQ